VLRNTLAALMALAFVAAGIFGWIYSARVDQEAHVREAVALEWAEATFGDVNDEKR
jgi:hypothetical protein